jgi:leader peptidase (prepilin peptidase)/N-methyltransferase
MGACVGSFLNVVIWRLPRGQSIVFPGSHCPICGRGIAWYDNIPLLSWLILRGKCRSCKAAISPRYLLVELTTALLVSGLYVCYYMLDIREMPTPPGTFLNSWPMFVAQAALLCGLLVCTAVDIEMWLVPLEVTWFVALIGIASSTYAPHPWMPQVTATTAAVGFAALAGIVVAVMLMRLGLIQPSFIDVEEKPVIDTKKGKSTKSKAPIAVAITSADGVNPRKEILRELLFLAPAILLAIAAWAVLTHVPAAGKAWSALLDRQSHPVLAVHLNGAAAAVFGYLIGGLLIWGTRIVGTLGFGKEAMGLGDVHILACVGAVCGWMVPTIAFFVAPVLGLLWAVYLFLRRGQRELPYGPWLAAASLLVMVFYDAFGDIIQQYLMLGRLLH